MPKRATPELLGAAGERFTPDDPRYRGVLDRQFNKRFRASPAYVHAVASTAQVVAAVDEAVRAGHRVVATSGGHCLEGFVSDPAVRVLIDLSPMRGIAWDAERRSVVVEAGATVGETFRALHERWGVVVPLGQHPDIGIGGHVAGGAFGFLCRQLGLAVDYLAAIEVVTVDANGHVAAVIASRNPDDPNHDLWWAHTGGGAGNFGIVTRCWFRSVDAAGDSPAAVLPASPASITTFTVWWAWDVIGEGGVARLIRQYGAWCARHAGADSPFASLWTLLIAHRQQLGRVVVRGLSTTGDGATAQMDACLAAVADGVGGAAPIERQTLSWLDFALDPFPDLFAGPPEGVHVKVKDALLKRPLTDRQIDIACEYLSRRDHDIPGGMLGLASYGGRINAVAHDATASAQLPVPGEATDGAFINHPDVDLADPAWNTAGVPWLTLYYQDHVGRLQRSKARWDPQNVFRHALSIPLP